jgi:8-oxo-dGTP pyrophosphatase MutT (NUDIX family)
MQSKAVIRFCQTRPVNGAFQGGKLERGETVIAGARREFKEETGIDVPAAIRERVVIQNAHYTLVRCHVQSIAEQVRLADVGVHPNSSNFAPQNAMIDDWELGELTMVKKAYLDIFLGKYQTPSQAVINALPYARPFSQSIDWYREMARYLMTH